MSDLFIEPDDATPLSAEEREGLIPTHIALRRELNELEQENILDADIWAFQRSRDPIDEAFGRSLHRRMFGKVWSWAGAYRLSDKNIGVPRGVIQLRLYELFDNIGYWAKNGAYSADEVAARFHHGLVFIHPFPNGNGRWSRLMADILLVRSGQPRFTLGNSTLRSAGEVRAAYIAALQAADRNDFRPLIAFLRS
ncbi:mobile mystery protein B [uncultured Phenylobacterium sp.]|uniref:mobile mystery protein B n=1 Tax=uncultured Phenylobacterium sp. TaxID=349273 RepID=UPI0025D17EE5|nr:mobile mystery protein B [uncultured Phenylobacterium sp.]